MEVGGGGCGATWNKIGYLKTYNDRKGEGVGKWFAVNVAG